MNNKSDKKGKKPVKKHVNKDVSLKTTIAERLSSEIVEKLNSLKK